ncbi:MAG: hypothetical protein ACLKAN_12345, partial [Alkaliphilus sp.]
QVPSVAKLGALESFSISFKRSIKTSTRTKIKRKNGGVVVMKNIISYMCLFDLFFSIPKEPPPIRRMGAGKLPISFTNGA